MTTFPASREGAKIIYLNELLSTPRRSSKIIFLNDIGLLRIEWLKRGEFNDAQMMVNLPGKTPRRSTSGSNDPGRDIRSESEDEHHK